MSEHFPLCIIPAAGKGTRMGGDAPKCLRRLKNGDLVASVVIDFWLQLADRVMVVVAPGDLQSWMMHNELESWAGEPEFALQPEPLGVVDAILWGLAEAGGAPPVFCVGLGDCLFDGKFDWSGPDGFHGVAVDEGDPDFARSYAVGTACDDPATPFVGGVVEKPLRGLGAYFFNWTVVAALEERREKGITDVVAALDGVRTVKFTGRYLNVTYPEDLERW